MIYIYDKDTLECVAIATNEESALNSNYNVDDYAWSYNSNTLNITDATEII